MTRLAGKSALITGAARGIGRAIALVLADAGADVVIGDRQDATGTVREIEAAGGSAASMRMDVSRSDQANDLVAFALGRLGRLDILVNNAGIAGSADDRETLQAKAEARIREMVSGQLIETHWDVTQNMSDAAWNRMIGVHLNGTFFCTREALRLMSRQNRGVIINMSSVAGLMGLDAVSHYSAAKAGILGFTRAVAREVASRGIRVNAICPGYIDTPMTQPMTPLIRAAVVARTPLGRWGEPQDIAATALFLASDDSGFYTGQWLSPNGGFFIG
jgi:3-oxoacyl-[acyl-carrier protein] reductase